MRPLITMLCLALGACAMLSPTPEQTSGKQEQPAAQQHAPQKVQVPLSELGTDFLYLAAENAIQQGQGELATRFLETLVEKDTKAVVPRIQLGGLLLRQGKSEQALEQIETALKQDRKLDPRIVENVHLLYTRALVATGRKKQAAEQLEKLLAEDPDRIHIRLMQARLQAEMGDLDAAQATIAAGLKREDSPALRKLQAEIYIRQNQLKKAEKTLKAMQKLAPDSETAALMLSQLAARQNDTVKAEYALRKFLAAHPASLRVGNALGRLMVQENRPREAIEIYKEIARRSGDNPDVLTTLGLLYYQQKMYKQAIVHFERILEKNSDAPVRFYLAASLEADGKADRARRIYTQITADDRDYPAAQLQLASLDFRENRLDEAAGRLTALIGDFPTLADAYSMLSSIRATQKRYKLLLRESEPALALKKISNNLLFNRAVAFEALAQYDDAEQSLRLILSRDSKHTEALNFLGYMYAERGVKLDEAESLIRRALEQKPEDGYYLDSLAWVYYKRGDYGRALNAQRRAVARVPDDATMQDHLGDILWRGGKHELARKAWSHAIELSKDAKAKPRLKQKIAKGL